MQITFRLRYRTNFGQSLFILGEHPALGEDKDAISMQYLNDQFWVCTVTFAAEDIPAGGITYHYVLRNPDGVLIHDWGNDRVLRPGLFDREEVLIVDSWNHAGYFENAFFTEPFRSVLLRRNGADRAIPVAGAGTHAFRVKAPLLSRSQTVCLLGSSPVLKNWVTAEPVLLGRADGDDYFMVRLDLSQTSFPISYKYGVYDLERRAFVRFEDGPNRTLDDFVTPQKQTIINDGFVVLPSNTWKGAGVSIPVFSLRSADSFGVGDFSDLKLLVDWCKRVGLKLIQVLPVNDTIATHTWVDSYPYAAISAFALHPLYLRLSDVVAPDNRSALDQLEGERQRLNALPAVDYEAVISSKIAFLKQIFPSQKEATFSSEEYRRLFERNRHWLTPYAVFCFLRDKYGTADTSRWPAHRRYNPKEAATLAAESAQSGDDITFHYFVQYHLHLQLTEATNYAHANGVILKGDIAIGVSRHGADLWQRPDLYHPEFQAGAPPDAFAVKGQNWGFPTYNWPRMKESGFAWWKQRFEQMSAYFDAFRIDHILGFFRIWSVPAHAVEGILGYFIPALPVLVSEFHQRGIAFDRGRYTLPYITEPVLREIFGPLCDEAKRQFLDGDLFGQYSLKLGFRTQHEVESWFASRESTERNERLKIGLFDLISNVLLFEAGDADVEQFHFRFAMETTASFRALDREKQHRLRELYIDYFFRRQDEFWMKEAMQKLPALKRVTNMLICGEDLGLVPACVPDVMKQLGLLSLEIQRMPKDLSRAFSSPKDAPYLSVVTPSTHDMSTIRGWWEEDRALTQRFYSQELGQPGDAPARCEPWVNQLIITQHLASPAMWSIFQLQDLLGIDASMRRENTADERINVPANPKNYWRYRMHISLEDLKRADGFNDGLRSLVRESGR